MLSKKKYAYKLRPTYGLGELLIEFFELDQDALINDLTELLSGNGFNVAEPEVAWMVDEVWIDVSSKSGKFTIIKDAYGFVFLMVVDKQGVIYTVDKILMNSVFLKKKRLTLTITN